MADNEEFDFELEEVETEGGVAEPLPAALEIGEAGEPVSPPAGTSRKGIPARILLGGLLLLLLAAGGVYLLTGTAVDSAGVASAVKPAPEKRPIAVPSRPAPTLVEVIETPSQPPSEVSPQSESAAETAPHPGKKEVRSVRTYTLRAGAFLLQSNRTKVEEKVRGLGFEPRVTPKKKKVAMTRLRIGSFSPAEGRAKVRELAADVPDAFCVPSRDQMVVYAGTFLNLEGAREYAGQLRQKGIRVEEESALIESTLSILSFGDFPDREAARKAAFRAKAAGLEVEIASVAGRKAG